ncbi:MAG: hypothetical protein H0W64_06855 [Gammaproteobacteria bacterium]|nr:hypothetical protein [Gammaproteobacteria bacterium]
MKKFIIIERNPLDDLIELILNKVPDYDAKFAAPKLKEKINAADQQKIFNFLDSNKIRTVQQLQTYLQEGGEFFSTPHKDFIRSYLEQWLIVGNKLKERVALPNSLWGEIVGKPFGSGALLELFLQFLPADSSVLAALQKKLQQMVQFSNFSKQACHLTNLLIATKLKADHLESHKPKILFIASEWQHWYLINIYTEICETYLTGLREAARQLLLKQDKLFFIYNNDTNVIEALEQYNECNITPAHPTLAAIVKYHSFLTDLHHTLVGNSPRAYLPRAWERNQLSEAAHRLETFKAKLDHGMNVLQLNLDAPLPSALLYNTVSGISDAIMMSKADQVWQYTTGFFRSKPPVPSTLGKEPHPLLEDTLPDASSKKMS